MEILLTNDDGIYAPGLEALAGELTRLGNVQVVAPLIEQSGVGHSITYLQPLMAENVFRHGVLFGHAVAGSPADCVKLAMLELCAKPPELLVSGINSGANVGINVLYSGTVAAAIEGAFFGVTSIAVSLATSDLPDFDRTARLAVALIEQLLARDTAAGALWNMNFPPSQPDWPRGVRLLPMGVGRERELMEKRVDPRGRTYYWSANDENGEHLLQPETDVAGLAEGYVTLTPLHFDLTHRPQLAAFRDLPWNLP